MARDNLSAPLSMSTSAVPGTFGSVFSGASAGGCQASQATSKVFKESELAKRNSLLKALNVLFDGADEFREEQIPGMKLFPEALQDMLGLTHNGIASTVGKLLLGPVITASHLSQLPLDVKACIEGLLHSVNDYQQFIQTKRASTLDMEKEVKENKIGFSANCQALCNNLGNISDELQKNIDGQFEHQGSAAKSHEHIAESSASTAALGSLSTASLVALMFDMIGSSFREVSASVEFSKLESTHPNEKNVYQAFSKCLQSFATKNSHDTFTSLRDLEEALSNFEQAKEMSGAHLVSGPSMSVFMRMLTAVPFVKTLQAVNSSTLALTAAHHALYQEKDQFSQLSQESAAKASLIQGSSEGDAQHHSQHVTAFCDQFDKAIEHIDREFQALEHYEAIKSSAIGTVRSNSALIIASSLIPGLTGMISREFSGSIDFTQNDKGSHQESKDVLKTRQEMTGADLDRLLSRVCALQERLERCKELGVSAPVALGMGEAVSSGSLITSLNVVAGMYSALRELRTLAESPSIPLQLDEAEQRQAKEYADSALGSNKKTAGTLGTAPVSENLSLHRYLQSVMEKVVLTHRSYKNFIQPGMDRNDLDSAGKSMIAFSQGNSTGFLLGSLGVLALIGLQSGISIEALFGGLRYSTELQRLSAGADRIESDNGSKFNFSFVSNATRLTEKSMGSSSIIQSGSRTTYLLAETAFSRSLTIALCHSGALKEILRRLVKQEEDKLVPAPGYSDSALISDALMPQMYDGILKVLDDAEANHTPIPGLNVDMASQLGSVTNASIATALCTHGVFISPILKSIVAAKKACVIEDEIRNEAVSVDSELSRIISTSLNIVQAFTANFNEEIHNIDDPLKNSSLAQTSAKSNVTGMATACAVSLLCEELFEICISRSLTLLDKKKIDDSVQKSKEQTQKDANLSRDAVAEDSAIGQENSATHVISALRLTVSRLGTALGDFAIEMERSPDLLQEKLQIHSSQVSLIKSMASTFSQCSASMLAISALLSNLPLTSAGSIDALRECIHSIDHDLVLRPVHSSEHTTINCDSESSLLTGIGTDCVSSILTAATKLLLQALVLGLDTTLSIAKIMEILCIHPRPEEALALELEALSQPNGLSKNTNDQSQSLLVAGTIGTAGVSIASKTGQSLSTEDSIRAFQAAVDQRIEQIALLEDEEQEDTLKLKKFYELLIRVLSGNSSIAYDNVVLRFHRGGYNLSSYHSEHGGILDSDTSHNSTRSNRSTSSNGFMDCDDAEALLNLFITRAYHQERQSDSLLNKLKQELIKHDKLSDQSQKTWKFIVSKVIDRLKLEDSRKSIFNPGNAKPSKQKWEERKEDLLHNWEHPIAENEQIISGPSSPSYGSTNA